MARPRISHENFLRVRHSELQDLTIFQLGVLVKLASIAAVSARPGYVCDETGKAFTLEEVAGLLKTAYLILSKNIAFLQNAGFIVFTDNGISITNWSRWVDKGLKQRREYMRQRRGNE